MKGYLLLHDGSIFELTKVKEKKNILVEIKSSSLNYLNMICLEENVEYRLSYDEEREYAISNEQYPFLEMRVKAKDGILGKVVSDNMPIEFHLHDLKSMITK